VPLPPQPDITGVGRSLFQCGLGSTNNLLPDEQVHCLPVSKPPDSIEAGMPKTSRAIQNARWAAALAARHAPPRTPCTHLEQIIVGGPGTQKSMMAVMGDPLCLLNRAVYGSRTPD
jgi:hypothetical protein